MSLRPEAGLWNFETIKTLVLDKLETRQTQGNRTNCQFIPGHFLQQNINHALLLDILQIVP